MWSHTRHHTKSGEKSIEFYARYPFSIEHKATNLSKHQVNLLCLKKYRLRSSHMVAIHKFN